MPLRLNRSRSGTSNAACRVCRSATEKQSRHADHVAQRRRLHGRLTEREPHGLADPGAAYRAEGRHRVPIDQGHGRQHDRGDAPRGGGAGTTSSPVDPIEASITAIAEYAPRRGARATTCRRAGAGRPVRTAPRRRRPATPAPAARDRRAPARVRSRIRTRGCRAGRLGRARAPAAAVRRLRWQTASWSYGSAPQRRLRPRSGAVPVFGTNLSR